MDESTIEDAVVADAAAQEVKPRHSWENEACANCGTALAGPHCQVCGQVADDLHRPIWALVHDAMEGLFALDGRFLKTVPPLLLRPGRVSEKYLSGARARFVQPVRLFLFASVVFLLAVSIATGDWTNVSFDDADFDAEALEGASVGLEALRDELAAEGHATPPGVALAQAEVDAAIRRAEGGGEAEAERADWRPEVKCAVRREFLPEELTASCVALLADREASRVADGETEDESTTFNIDGFEGLPLDVRRRLTRNAERVIDDQSLYREEVQRWMSRMLIALFPIYAALLGLTHFWKRRFYYYDHVVVSLHFHAFIFLLLTIAIAASVVVPIWLLIPAVLVWSNVYLYKTHRLVYGCGRFSSALRTLVLDGAYFVILQMVLVVLLIGGFLTV